MLRIRVEAPSSPPAVDKVVDGVARLVGAGFEVNVAEPLLRGSHGYLNGDDAARTASLQAALLSDVDVVWLARGGYGLTRVIEGLQLSAGMPIVVGFSDATALFCRLRAVGGRAVHGPLLTTVAAEPFDSFDLLTRVLTRRAAGHAWPLVHVGGPALDAEGPVFAGNLCVLAAVAGTPAMPSLAGCVLVLEEVGERPYRIDRMMTQLLSAHALGGVRAIVIGHLTGCSEPATPGAVSGRTVPAALDVLVERAATLGIPVLAGMPLGHEAPNHALPLGARVAVRFQAGEGSLTLLQDLP